MAGFQNMPNRPEAKHGAPGNFPVRMARSGRQQVAQGYAPTTIGAVAEQTAHENDLFWLVACLVLGFACLIALLFWLYRIMTGQVDGSRLATLGYVLVFYGLCIGGGWLWGRYQRSPEDEEHQRQFEHMQRQVEQLFQSKQSLQQALQKALAGSGGSAKESQGMGVKNIPSQIARIGPPPSIYDQQLEPSDSSDLIAHPHEKSFPARDESNMLDHGWRVLGASRRGYGHGYEGKYREDDFHVQMFPGSAGPTIALVAIADGVGNKSLSRWGARAAVLGATSLTDQEMQPFRKALHRFKDQEVLNQAAQAVLLETLSHARDAIVRCARQAQVHVDELQSTLLVFLAVAPSPETLVLASVQIGDGALLAHRVNPVQNQPIASNWRWLQHPQIQGAGNEVHPFLHSTEEEWQQYMHYELLSSVDGVIAMTDGIADDIEAPFPSANNPQPDPFTLVDDFYQRIVVPVAQATQPTETLLNHLAYKKKQSYDDRTLVYLYR
ncbi:MAG: protein phosphatase 2C domain-containing protein [Ktedonobacteraceae bacterium]